MGGQVASPSIGIEVRVEHSYVDGLLDAHGGPFIFTLMPMEGHLGQTRIKLPCTPSIKGK